MTDYQFIFRILFSSQVFICLCLDKCVCSELWYWPAQLWLWCLWTLSLDSVILDFEVSFGASVFPVSVQTRNINVSNHPSFYFLLCKQWFLCFSAGFKNKLLGHCLSRRASPAILLLAAVATGVYLFCSCDSTSSNFTFFSLLQSLLCWRNNFCADWTLRLSRKWWEALHGEQKQLKLKHTLLADLQGPVCAALYSKKKKKDKKPFPCFDIFPLLDTQRPQNGAVHPFLGNLCCEQKCPWTLLLQLLELRVLCGYWEIGSGRCFANTPCLQWGSHLTLHHANGNQSYLTAWYQSWRSCTCLGGEIVPLFFDLWLPRETSISDAGIGQQNSSSLSPGEPGEIPCQAPFCAVRVNCASTVYVWGTQTGHISSYCPCRAHAMEEKLIQGTQPWLFHLLPAWTARWRTGSLMQAVGSSTAQIPGITYNFDSILGIQWYLEDQPRLFSL